jgi:hypothetical protein
MRILTTSELEQIINSNLVLDCPRISLIPSSLESSRPSYKGPGILTPTKEGYWNLKLFCQGEASHPGDIPYPRTPAGKLLDELDYYSFSAFDINGREWTTEKILRLDLSVNQTNGYEVISCKIDELKTIRESQSKVDKQCVEILFLGDINIPINTSTSTIIFVGGKEQSRELQSNVATFETNGFIIEIRKEQNCLYLLANSSSSPLTDAVVIGLLESLQFILAQPLEWSVLELANGTTWETRIKASLGNKLGMRQKPPIHIQYARNINSIINLFDKFFTDSINRQKNTKPEIFDQIWKLLYVRSLHLPIEVLALGVAIEGLLKDRFLETNISEKTLEEQISKAKKVIEDSDLEDKIKKRISGFLPNLKQARPIDQLHALKDRGLIEERLIKAWSELRNTAAHANKMCLSGKHV